ncbi:MAG: hypothetical protein E7273_07195 [Pseudobutyrivibrio ruminis]|nr:hypothetical protein [Pseudobutyrivibrio ruminis]
MQSEHVAIGQIKEQFDRVESILDDYMFRLDITGKNALRFSLLTEEALRLAKSIAGEKTGVELWFDGNARVSHICLQLETTIDANKKQEFLSISSTGENKADRTFFDGLRDFFIKPEAPTWSLVEYEAELMKKRKDDKYSMEAWDNLERSLLASLADDITVGVKDNHVLMIITKDFSKSLSNVGSRKPIVISNQIYLNSEESILEAAYKKVDGCVESVNLSGKDKLRVKLLLEETIGMFEEMTGEFTALMWIEKYDGQCAIRLVGNTKIDADKKYDLLSMSTSGENALVHGFMGKVKDIIQTGILNYESVMKLKQEYNGVSVNYAGLGVYSDVGVATNPTAFSGMMWSMIDYKNELEHGKAENEGMMAAWDELEKSIVASVADDVIVGVKDNKVQMTIIYKMKEE